MSATRLPDGSVVMRPSGQRAVTPKGTGTAIHRPAVAQGAGAGASGTLLTPKLKGRAPAARNAYS
jgi:hypothetical protein